MRREPPASRLLPGKIRGLHRIGGALRAELRAQDDRFDEGAEAVLVGGEFCFHFGKQRIVGHQQHAAEAVGEQFACEVVDEVALAVGADVVVQPREARAARAARKIRARIDGVARKILRASLADRAEALEGEAE